MNSGIEIARIKENLKGIKCSLESLTDENFDSKLSEVNFQIKIVNNLRKKLKESYPGDKPENMEGELNKSTKEIRLLFDNIISEKKNQQIEISEQLKVLQNQKKIANYRQ